MKSKVVNHKAATRERVRQIQMDELKQLRKILENQCSTEELLF